MRFCPEDPKCGECEACLREATGSATMTPCPYCGTLEDARAALAELDALLAAGARLGSAALALEDYLYTREPKNQQRDLAAASEEWRIAANAVRTRMAVVRRRLAEAR